MSTEARQGLLAVILGMGGIAIVGFGVVVGGILGTVNADRMARWLEPEDTGFWTSTPLPGGVERDPRESYGPRCRRAEKASVQHRATTTSVLFTTALPAATVC